MRICKVPRHFPVTPIQVLKELVLQRGLKLSIQQVACLQMLWLLLRSVSRNIADYLDLAQILQSGREMGAPVGEEQKKNKQRPTWTRTFVCLAHTDVERMPSVNENIELKEASLGEKRLTNFLLTTTAKILTKKLRSAYPKLFGAGGYILLRGGHSRIFQKLDPPYHVSRLKERVGQGKIFIRPLQGDLELT